MTVKVTFEFDTAADAAAFLQDFDSPQREVAATPRRGRPRKAAQDEAPAAAAPAAAPASQAAAPAPVQAAAAAPAAVPYKDVADAITELSESDYDGAVALLASFGAKTARDLKPEQFGAFVEQARAKLAKKPVSLI